MHEPNSQSLNGLSRTVVQRALVSGSVASALSAVALSACSQYEEGSLAGALNGPSQWLWGEAEAHTREASWRHTAVGYCIHHASSLLWAGAYEALGAAPLREKANLSVLSRATLIAALAYFVDYNLTPRRLRPGFRKHLTTPSIGLAYATFAAGLALTSVARRGE